MSAVTSMQEHYRTSGDAAFDQERRIGGSFGVETIHARQDVHETPDPAMPQLALIGVLKMSDHTELDFGDGDAASSIS